jgi:hypothetical protein
MDKNNNILEWKYSGVYGITTTFWFGANKQVC